MQHLLTCTSPSGMHAASSDGLALISATYDAKRRALEQGQVDAIEAAHCHLPN